MLTLSDMRTENGKAYVLLMPSLILAVMFSFYPLVKSVAGSFLTISQQGEVRGFAGLMNYISLFSDPAFPASIRHTLLFILMFLPLNTALTLLAAILTRRKTRWGGIAEYIFFMPMAVSLSSLSLIFREMFRGRVSVINQILDTDIAWLDSPGTALLVLAFLGVFLDFGIDYILLLSSFRRIDRNILEAAALDGAGNLRTLISIELPEIRTMLSVTVFLAAKDALLISAPVMILTQGGPFRSTETIMYYYYLEAFRSGNRGAESTITTLITIIAVIIMAMIASRRKNDWKNI